MYRGTRHIHFQFGETFMRQGNLKHYYRRNFDTILKLNQVPIILSSVKN